MKTRPIIVVNNIIASKGIWFNKYLKPVDICDITDSFFLIMTGSLNLTLLIEIKAITLKMKAPINVPMAVNAEMRKLNEDDAINCPVFAFDDAAPITRGNSSLSGTISCTIATIEG